MKKDEQIEKIKKLKVLCDNTIIMADNVFITPHKGPDFDAIGACIGLAEITKKMNKNTFIILEEKDEDLEPGVKIILSKVSQNYHFITKADLPNFIIGNKNLLITADVNKKKCVHISDCLNMFNDILIIDHHFVDEDTIITNNKFIDTTFSSTCEIITHLLHLYHKKYNRDCATYLLAGIILDTKNLTQNTSIPTLKVVIKLLEHGANREYINELFTQDDEKIKQIEELVSYAMFESYTYAITTNSHDPKTIYKKEDLAKTADLLMKYPIDASFAIGYLDNNTIGISARSNGQINVGQIMGLFNGGGNQQSAATTIEAYHTPDEVAKILNKVLTPAYKSDKCENNT